VKFESGIELALKEIHIRDKQNRMAVEREISIHSSLRHKNIIRLEGVRIELADKIGILMELAHYGTLENVIHDLTPLDINQWRVKFSQDVAEGMAYLYSLNPPVCHRDIKTKNVLIVNDRGVPTAKIGDFGIAQRGETEASNLGLLYTTTYAPERLILDSEGSVPPFTQKCDVYSFSILMWDMLTKENFRECISSVGQFKESKLMAGYIPQVDVVFPDPVLNSMVDLSQEARNLKFLKLIASGQRPETPECPCHEYVEVMEMCWQQEPNQRPTFKELVGMLNEIDEEFDQPCNIEKDVLATLKSELCEKWCCSSPPT